MKHVAAACALFLLCACGGGGGGSGAPGIIPVSSSTPSSPPRSGSPSPSPSAKPASPTPSPVKSSTPSPSPVPVMTDDWTTYAHDVTRTGFEQMNTGINATSVSNLKLAWRVTPDQACQSQASNATMIVDEASPIVAGGLVYYADICGVVAALQSVLPR